MQNASRRENETRKVNWARITKGILYLTRITNIIIPIRVINSKAQKWPGKSNKRMKGLAPGDYKEWWGLWKTEELMSCPGGAAIFI